MPELPEVETTLRGIMPHIHQQKINCVRVRQYQLRWPIPQDIQQRLYNQCVQTIARRGKYLLLGLDSGTVIIHLGMSGRLRILPLNTEPQKHDHIDIEFANNLLLRFTDPRRFGAFLWTGLRVELHPLLKNLGPEPLEKFFTWKYLWQVAQGRKIAIKTFIMDSKIVVGIGNIYANEALFLAGIHPSTPAALVPAESFQQLVKAIKKILSQAIQQGGTTLKDFFGTDGQAGYFANQLNVYGRDDLPCISCKDILQVIRIGQRSTFFCANCQPLKIK